MDRTRKKRTLESEGVAYPKPKRGRKAFRTPEHFTAYRRIAQRLHRARVSGDSKAEKEAKNLLNALLNDELSPASPELEPRQTRVR